jgi:polyisoprenoid-binding protein YceI
MMTLKMKQRPKLQTSTVLALLLTAAVALVLAAPAVAAPRVLEFDPGATDITFFLEATGHDVHGSFPFDGGVLELDPETGTVTGELRINAEEAESGNDKRDKKMHEEVLESHLYPSIVFQAERLEGTLSETGRSEVKIHGTVTIDGGEHPLTLPAVVELDGDRWTAETTFVVPFVEWGMNDPSIFFLRVAKEVEVTVSSAGTLAPAQSSMAAVTE